MKVSDIEVGRHVRIETHSDAFRILYDENQRADYIAQYGNVEVKYDEVCRVYRVAEFAAIIQRYSEIKAIDCLRWGCE